MTPPPDFPGTPDHDAPRAWSGPEPLSGRMSSWYNDARPHPTARARQLQMIAGALLDAEMPRTPAERTPRRSARRIISLAAAAAMVLFVGAGALRRLRAPAPEQPSGALPLVQDTPASGAREVGFTLRLPDGDVHQVTLAGDFNAWNASALPMQRDPVDGAWRVRVALAPGRHTYSFVVDGTRWVIDPAAPRTVDGVLGPANVIAIPGES